MALLRLALLGPFLVMADDRAVTGFESNKARALLAYLAADPGHPHSRDALAELLWPEQPAATASANLRHVLAHLRHVLAHLRHVLADATNEPPSLLADANTIQLNPAAALEVDLAHFESLVAATTASACRAAVGLVRGPFLEGLAVDGSPGFEEWLAVMREKTDRTLILALGYLAGDAVQCGDFIQAADWTRRQTALEPWNEDAHAQLMALLALGGQRAAALHQAAVCRKALAAELDVAPQPATAALAARIRAGQVTPDDLHPFHGKTLLFAAKPTPYRNVPPTRTPFFGRGGELAQIAADLADPNCRLLTLVGPGGIGKTRLAIAATTQNAASFADGACFVGLTSVTQGELLANEILHSLDMPSPSYPWVQLVEALCDRALLLVLDNFEQLVESAGRLADLLDAAPKLKLLVTSRTRLNLAAEWLIPLAGLAVPDTPAEGVVELVAAESPPVAAWSQVEAYSAVQLFVHGMRRLQPDVALTPADAATTVRICRLVDGNPLAIELAAGWTRTLSPAAVLAELGRGLDLLATTQRDAPERHRSIRAVFDHTWALLTPREQGVLRQLAVFRGGFTPASAAVVAGATAADLAGLVDKSWLRMRPNDRGEMHELVRQYCEERLEHEHEALSGESVAAVRDRFGVYIAAYLREQIAGANFRHKVTGALVAELGNIQAVWDWVVQHGSVEVGLDLVWAIYILADMLAWMHPMVQLFASERPRLVAQLQPTADPVRRAVAGAMLSWIEYACAHLYRRLGLLAEEQGALTRLQALIDAGVATPDMPHHILMDKGLQAQVHGRWAEARRMYAAMLYGVTLHPVDYTVMGRETGSIFLSAHCHGLAAWCALLEGDYPTAHARFRRAIALREAIGELRFRAHNLSIWAWLQYLEGDTATALHTAQQALQLSRSFGDQLGMRYACVSLGRVQTAIGQDEAARASLYDALMLGRQSGELRLILEPLTELGRLELARGNVAAAKAHFDAGLAAFAKLNEPHSVFIVGVWLGLGWAALAEQDWETARRRFVQTATAVGCTAWQLLDAAAGLAEVDMAQGRVDEAAALLAVVAAAPPTAAFTRRRAADTSARLGLTLPDAALPDWRAALAARLAAWPRAGSPTHVGGGAQ